MTPAMFAVVLLAVSLLFFSAEIFIPSGGLITVLAVISLVASILFAFRAWWGDSSSLFWVFVAVELALVPTVVIGSVQLLPYIPWGSRVLLEPPSADEIIGYQDELDRLASLVGRFGETVTDLNPGGMVEIDGERLHCEGDGMMLSRGQSVEVIAISGNRLRVRPSDRPAETSADETATSAPPLDFGEFDR